MLKEPMLNTKSINDYVTKITSDSINVHVPNDKYSCILINISYDNSKYIMYIPCDNLDKEQINDYIARFIIRYNFDEYDSVKDMEYYILSDLLKENISSNVSEANKFIKEYLNDFKEINMDAFSLSILNNGNMNIDLKPKKIDKQPEEITNEALEKKDEIQSKKKDPIIKDDSVNIDFKKGNLDYNLAICNCSDNIYMLPKEFYEYENTIDGIYMHNLCLRFYTNERLKHYYQNKTLRDKFYADTIEFNIKPDKKIRRMQNAAENPLKDMIKDGYVRISNKNYFDIIPFDNMEEYIKFEDLSFIYEEYIKLYNQFIEDRQPDQGGYK